MHVLDESAVKRFLEESVHYQTEDALLLFCLFFAFLAAICVANYQICKVKPSDSGPDHYSHSEGKA